MGSIALLGTPFVGMFSEGNPDSWGENPVLAFIGLWALASLACLVAGWKVFYGREWARFLAIGLYLTLAAAFSSVLPLMLINLAFAGVLVFRWRASPRQPS